MFSRRILLAAATAILAIATAPFSVAASGKGISTPVQLTRATVKFCDTTCGVNFSLATTRDIAVETTWHFLPAGTNVQKIVVIMPTGDIYQKFQSKVATGVATTNKARGFAPARNTNIIPVAGSAIQQRNLVGRWTVQVYLNDVLVTSNTLTFK